MNTSNSYNTSSIHDDEVEAGLLDMVDLPLDFDDLISPLDGLFRCTSASSLFSQERDGIKVIQQYQAVICNQECAAPITEATIMLRTFKQVYLKNKGDGSKSDCDHYKDIMTEYLRLLNTRFPNRSQSEPILLVQLSGNSHELDIVDNEYPFKYMQESDFERTNGTGRDPTLGDEFSCTFGAAKTREAILMYFFNDNNGMPSPLALVEQLARCVEGMPSSPPLSFFKKELSKVRRELVDPDLPGCREMQETIIAVKMDMLREMWKEVKFRDSEGNESTLEKIFIKSKESKIQHPVSSRQKRRSTDSQHSYKSRVTKKPKLALRQTPEDPMYSCSDNWTVATDSKILGADIVRLMPQSVHFIAGVAYFDVHLKDPSHQVADNFHVRQTISSFFAEQLQKASFLNGLYDSEGRVVYRVLDEIEGVLEKLKNTPLDRLGGSFPHSVCVWKQVCPDGRRHLKRSTWESAYFRKVVSTHEMKDVLQPPLKSSLKKLPIPARSNL